MFGEDQTVCMQCRSLYLQDNPPRLLIMCGHTFCQTCILSFISKKKSEGKYTLTCPLDKMTTQLVANDPSIFPKNLSVLNMAIKKSAGPQTRHKIPLNQTETNQHIRSKSSVISLECEYSKNQISRQYFELDKENSGSNSQSEVINNSCLLHQKPLQLVCLRELTKICSSCVIFGEHKGHNVKSLQEAEETANKLTQTLQLILSQTQDCFSRLNSEIVYQKVFSMIKTKKSDIVNQIETKFNTLRHQITQAQQRTIQKLNQKMNQCSNLIQTKLSEAKNVRSNHKQWQQNLLQQIEQLRNENDQIRIKTALKIDSFLTISEKNLQEFRFIQSDFIEECEKIVENIVLNSNEDEMVYKLKSYCKLEDSRNSFLEFRGSRVSQHRQLTEEILLDESDGCMMSCLNLNKPARLKTYQNMNIKCESKGNMGKSMIMSKAFYVQKNVNTQKQRMSMGSFYRKTHDQITASRTKLKKTNSHRSTVINFLKTNQISLKLQPKIQIILSGGSDTLDLTNGELPNEKLLLIMNFIKNCTIPILKLVKNKINDQCFTKLASFMENTVMLNASRNELTDKSMEFLLQERREGKLKNLKSLMIGQNKIVDRKSKQILEELKKIGIHVCN